MSIGIEWVNNYHGRPGLLNLSHNDDLARGFYNTLHGVKQFEWGDNAAWDQDFEHFSSKDHVSFDKMTFGYYAFSPFEFQKYLFPVYEVRATQRTELLGNHPLTLYIPAVESDPEVMKTQNSKSTRRKPDDRIHKIVVPSRQTPFSLLKGEINIK